jgi:phenylpyruvate tautomerase PptA (4-oxalocrotonate tautomerase family)
MPVLKIQTNVDIPEEAKKGLLHDASAKVAAILGKPERYVMVLLEPNPHMLFAADNSPLAYLELKSIGLPSERTGTLSEGLTDLINQHLSIPADRVYIEFANAERHMWGWSGGTF